MAKFWHNFATFGKDFDEATCNFTEISAKIEFRKELQKVSFLTTTVLQSRDQNTRHLSEARHTS